MQVCPFQLDESDLVLERQASPASHGKPKVLAICREETTVSRSQTSLHPVPVFVTEIAQASDSISLFKS